MPKKEKNPDFIAFSKQDNWKSFDYNCRILDSFASLLHFKSACAGVFKHKDDLYLSYNKQVNPTEKLIIAQVSQMRDFVYKGSAEQLLTLYLLLNIDYIEFIKNQSNHEKKSQNLANQEFRKILEEFRFCYTKLKPALQLDLSQKKLDTDDLNKYGDIANCYYKLIGFNLQNKIIESEEMKEHLFRPMQDSHKIYYWIHNKDYKFNEVKVLDNPSELHTECNIALQFPTYFFAYFKAEQFEIASKYIGIAKLCCGFCHKYLDVKEYEYRGTHGVCDQAWKMYSGPFEEEFKTHVLGNSSIEVVPGKEVFQHRRLSFDDFEKDILLKQFQDCTNLAELKDKLGLIYIPEPAIIQTTTTYTATGITPSSIPDILANLGTIDLTGEAAEPLS